MEKEPNIQQEAGTPLAINKFYFFTTWENDFASSSACTNGFAGFHPLNNLAAQDSGCHQCSSTVISDLLLFIG